MPSSEAYHRMSLKSSARLVVVYDRTSHSRPQRHRGPSHHATYTAWYNWHYSGGSVRRNQHSYVAGHHQHGHWIIGNDKQLGTFGHIQQCLMMHSFTACTEWCYCCEMPPKPSPPVSDQRVLVPNLTQTLSPGLLYFANRQSPFHSWLRQRSDATITFEQLTTRPYHHHYFRCG